MNGLSAMPELDCRRQSAFYLGLAETLLPLLGGNPNEAFAHHVVDFAWHAIEEQNIDGITLLDLIHSDEDTGIEVIMGAENDRFLWNIWNCLANGPYVQAYCAFQETGAKRMPEPLDSFNVLDAYSDFVNSYKAVSTHSCVVDAFRAFLAGLPDEYLKHSIVADELTRLFETE